MKMKRYWFDLELGLGYLDLGYLVFSMEFCDGFFFMFCARKWGGMGLIGMVREGYG